MNNIEILEEFIEDYKELVTQKKEVIIDYKYLKEKVQAIENLIKENKELKEKAKNTMGLIGANYIHKDKVKEKIKELDSIYQQEIKQKYNGRYYHQLSYAIQILKELEEGE